MQISLDSREAGQSGRPVSRWGASFARASSSGRAPNRPIRCRLSFVFVSRDRPAGRGGGGAGACQEQEKNFARSLTRAQRVLISIVRSLLQFVAPGRSLSLRQTCAFASTPPLALPHFAPRALTLKREQLELARMQVVRMKS